MNRPERQLRSLGERVFAKDLGAWGEITNIIGDLYVLKLDGDRWATVPEEQVYERDLDAARN